jgi:hypothetical protein
MVSSPERQSSLTAGASALLNAHLRSRGIAASDVYQLRYRVRDHVLRPLEATARPRRPHFCSHREQRPFTSEEPLFWSGAKTRTI